MYLLIKKISAAFALPIFAAALTISSVAYAIPPVDTTIDGLGIDLKTGAYRLDRQVLSIGPIDTPDLMTLAISYDSREADIGPMGKGWSHSYDIRALREVVGGNTVFSIVSGMSVTKFTKSSGIYLADRRDGGLLSSSVSGAFEHFTYRTRNGDILTFAPSNNMDCQSSSIPCDYHIETLTKANGEKLVFSYVGSGGQGSTWTIGNLMSVNSSLGWNLSFKYNGASRISTAQMVNLAQDYCAPSYGGQPWCDRTNWPKITLAYTSGNQLASVTDTTGGVWRYGYDSAGRMIWTRRPTDTSNHASITYNTSGVVTKKTIAGVGSWTYSITGSQTTITNPLGQTQTVYFGSASQPQWIKDGLNRQTSFTYDSSGRLTRQTNPAGDYVQFTYDARGNVTETRRVAKPGSSLANIVTTAGYPASCSTSEAVRCNKPLWVRDAKGAQTDFTYHATTGAPLQ